MTKGIVFTKGIYCVWSDSNEGGVQSLARRSRYSIRLLKFECDCFLTQTAYFGAPEPLVICIGPKDILHVAGSNLAVCLRAGPRLLRTVRAWRTRVGL
jgi:hypothetical protein